MFRRQKVKIVTSRDSRTESNGKISVSEGRDIPPSSIPETNILLYYRLRSIFPRVCISRREYPRGNPVSTIHIVRIIDILLSIAGCHRDSHCRSLNTIERLIDCRKVETSSTHS